MRSTKHQYIHRLFCENNLLIKEKKKTKYTRLVMIKTNPPITSAKNYTKKNQKSKNGQTKP